VLLLVCAYDSLTLVIIPESLTVTIFSAGYMLSLATPAENYC
jgi:hypothetical protein